jgi:hypothetical protein
MSAVPEFIPRSGACLVSRAVADGAEPVARAVRHQPGGGPDNGWRIFGESDARTQSEDALVRLSFNEACAIEPALIGIYDFDLGTDLTISRESGRIRVLETSSGREVPPENFYVPPDQRLGSERTAPAAPGQPSAGAGGRRKAGEACILSRNVLMGRGRIAFALRHQPNNPADSGWRVFSEFDSNEFVNDSANMAIVLWDTVVGYEPAMAAVRDLPVGSDVEIRRSADAPPRVWIVNENRYLD